MGFHSLNIENSFNVFHDIPTNDHVGILTYADDIAIRDSNISVRKQFKIYREENPRILNPT